MAVHLGAGHGILEGEQDITQIDFRDRPVLMDLGQFNIRKVDLAADARQFIDVLRSRLEPFVFLQTAYQLCSRVCLIFLDVARPGQQHTGLDLSQHR